METSRSASRWAASYGTPFAGERVAVAAGGGRRKFETEKSDPVHGRARRVGRLFRQRVARTRASWVDTEPRPRLAHSALPALRTGSRQIVSRTTPGRSFRTNLPQGLKLLPDYPVSAAARAAGLPEYVFGVEGARWLVWRWLWNGYLGYDFDTVARELRAGGASLELVASLPDSRWENRPELHFHRFPGGTYAFPFGIAHQLEMRRGVAQIFRVNPPAKLENGEPR